MMPDEGIKSHLHLQSHDMVVASVIGLCGCQNA